MRLVPISKCKISISAYEVSLSHMKIWCWFQSAFINRVFFFFYYLSFTALLANTYADDATYEHQNKNKQFTEADRGVFSEIL